MNGISASSPFDFPFRIDASIIFGNNILTVSLVSPHNRGWLMLRIRIIGSPIFNWLIHNFFGIYNTYRLAWNFFLNCKVNCIDVNVFCWKISTLAKPLGIFVIYKICEKTFWINCSINETITRKFNGNKIQLVSESTGTFLLPMFNSLKMWLPTRRAADIRTNWTSMWFSAQFSKGAKL